MSSQGDLERWVRAQLDAARQPGLVDVLAVAPHPTRALVACQLRVRRDAGEPEDTVGVVDLATGSVHHLELGGAPARSPVWSPTGDRLVVLVSTDGQTTAWVLDGATYDAVARSGADGEVEAVAWSPGGERLALLVAQAGAELSDVHGSGTVGEPAAESWRPEVSPRADGGRRTAQVWELSSDELSVRCPELNVWELDWCGADLVVLGSDGAGEGAWYAAALWLLSPDGVRAPLHEPRAQLAQPRGASERWSVLAGPASDRGLLAGDLLVGDRAGGVRVADTHGVDVTDHRWVDADRIVVAGLRGLDTVFGVVDAATGELVELLVTDATSGLHQPELGGLTADGDLIVVLERHDLPPTLTLVSADGRRELLSTAGPGTAHVVAHSGSTRRFAWTSTDGLGIEGMLTEPPGPGPFPAVLHIHGGPVAAWRDGWLGKDPYTAALVARGFAVLRPNPRGSAGRGAAFIEHVIGAMGGLDCDDVVSGAAALVESGVAAPGRVGITGNSYGGFLAAWAPCLSTTFAAAVSRSPVTDWRSQHLTSNLAEFDQLFVGGDPFDPASAYATRSPLLRHQQIQTPMLLTAGARDLATPASQAVQLHRALLRTGVPTELAVYPEEGHGVRGVEALEDQLARMLRWFETYL